METICERTFMKIALLTNEYPPNIYGGAGVHMEYLSRELARLDRRKHRLEIFCFGDQDEASDNLVVKGVHPAFEHTARDARHLKLFDALTRNTIMAGSVKEADLVHCHTWYTHFAGCLIKQLLGVPLVLTTHSLEPHRPWKAEQLGTAYNASSWLEKTAYQNADGVIAVSRSMKSDVHELYKVPSEKIRVIRNGIDLDEYRPRPNPAILEYYGIEPDKPFVLFVGRITRQKGIIHLVDAIKYLRSGIQVVLCAGAPDTADIGREMEERVERARSETDNEILWISEIVPKDRVVSLYTHASLFVCPSVYEPFGIINLEAMACKTPVVASAVGGIIEVVVQDETGLLVPFEPVSADDFAPREPERFSRDLAHAINSLILSPERLARMGAKSRQRVEEHFSWAAIARQTLEFYQSVIDS
ncbi:MAG: glycogen synthase [Blastocatellia bacterium]|nr:glycogen synthase [Blastocatellia bacterium]